MIHCTSSTISACLYLYQELVTPVIQAFKALGVVHVMYKHTAICASVECNAQALEAFLTSSVPYLHIHLFHNPM